MNSAPSQDGSAASFYGSFNARWIEPATVARGFVYVSHFGKLTRRCNTILAGPRGCGKTTLLKMLTRQALDVWKTARAPQDAPNPFDYPSFEAIYLPADARWYRELAPPGSQTGHARSHGTDDPIVGRTQRVLINCAMMRSFLAWLSYAVTDQQELTTICAEWANLWNLRRRVPHPSDLELGLGQTAMQIRSAINANGWSAALGDELKTLAPCYSADLLDLAETTVLAAAKVRPQLSDKTWALCFDELELAPSWMQQELLLATRSRAQKFLFKLTWSPIVPFLQDQGPEASQDYDIVRLWYSHVRDGYAFCEDLGDALVRNRYGSQASVRGLLNEEGTAVDTLVDADDRSPADEKPSLDPAYERSLRRLAARDKSFSDALLKQSIDLSNLAARPDGVDDAFLRKAKPIVLFRDEFWGEARLRSRKKPYPLYCGAKTLFAMCDGNPRWLVGLLTDLIELGATGSAYQPIAPRKQASILSDASARFYRRLSAIPVDSPYSPSLIALLDRISDFFRAEVLGQNFNLDPSGTVLVDSDNRDMAPTISRALEIGAIVAVGSGLQDVPSQLNGMKFRLSFMLSPTKKLLMRTLRETSLSAIGDKLAVPGQLSLWSGPRGARK